MSSKRFPVLRNPRAVALAAAFFLVTVPTALAQRAEIYEGEVDGIRISVRHSATGEEIQSLPPGETLTLEPGERVLLRPFVPNDKNPTGERQYLSAEFSVEAKGSVNIEVVERDPQYGRVVIEARRGGAGKAATLRYRLTGELKLARASLAEGVIPIEIAAAEAAPPVTQPVAPPPRRGVTLYEDSYYRGDSETFYEDSTDLRFGRIRNDRASSVKVPEGCTATLYRDIGYQGKFAVLRSDTPELERTPVGNDAVSSLKVKCE